MAGNGIIQVSLYLLILLLTVKPLGWYMAKVYSGNITIFKSIEYFFYRVSGVHSDAEMNWKSYLGAVLLFNFFGILLVYALQRWQFFLPLNPEHWPAVAPDLAFNTAVSFVTNTNWQSYSGESSLSYLTQTLALTVQNFLSAATGMALLIAFTRGITRSETIHLGNFWVDIIRGVLYILLPLAFIFAIFLTSTGVIQNYKPYQIITTLEASQQQAIPMGPVASQVAIKQLGTNGGGFFNTNSAHPFENPNPASNFFEMLAILLIPAAFCFTFGFLTQDLRQSYAIFATMLILFILFTLGTVYFEQQGNPAFSAMGIDQKAYPGLSPGGNMEGKETRFGILNSALWATATTASANGSVNAMLDSFTALGGLIPLWFMQLGEVVFGGVGSGLYGMLLVIILTVFVAGLMVGRTPEYLGKKIEPFEMKMASFAVLIIPLFILLLSGIAVIVPYGNTAILNPGMHGLTEILYAFTSMTHNNGSAFSGLNANNPFYNTLGGILMLIGRYWVAIPVLAIAGALAGKKSMAPNAGTLPTHTPFFIILTLGIIIILGALIFFPALALGPIAEYLRLWGVYGH